MNFKPTFIILTFLVLSINVFGQYNYIQKLGDLGTIALPDTPKLVEKDGSKIYTANYQGVIFMAAASDISGEPQSILKKNSLSSIYSKYMNGMLRETNGTLFYNNKIDINGHEGVEFGYKADLNGQPTFRYHHAVLLNDTILLSSIWSSDSLSKDHKNLSLFFNGLKIKSKEQISHDNAVNYGRKTGKVIGILLVIFIPILLGIGIVFIIKRIAYGKKQ